MRLRGGCCSVGAGGSGVGEDECGDAAGVDGVVACGEEDVGVAVGAEWWHGYVVGWYSGFDELEAGECGYVGVGAWGGGVWVGDEVWWELCGDLW